jgi:hypothetical protein
MADEIICSRSRLTGLVVFVSLQLSNRLLSGTGNPHGNMLTLLNCKFFRLLRSLSEEEYKELERWLQSPWNNSNKNLVRMLTRLKKYHPALEDRRLTKEKLFRQILPNGKYSDRRMNNLLSEAYLATERFLIFQRLARDQILQRELLNEEFQWRHLNDWFFRSTEELIAQLEEKPIKDWEEHLSLYRLYRSIYHHPNQETRVQSGSPALISMEEQLDLVYLLEKAAILNEKISRSNVLKGESHEVGAAIKRWKAAAEGVEHPSVILYQLRFDYYEAHRLEQHHRLREQVLSSLHQLNSKEQKIHLFSLINDSIKFVRSGQLLMADLLSLYKQGLATGVLLNQGKITESTYTTVVVLSNTNMDFAYTCYFMDHYTGKLEEKSRDDCMQWGRAHTAYWEGKLEACLEILQQHIFQQFYFQLLGRVLNTQAYFDLYLRDDSYQFFLFNFLDAFEKWLNREKIWSKRNKVSFLRFVQKCRTLARSYSEIDFQADKVEALLNNVSNIQALDWLQRKQQEVLERRK